MSSNQRKKILIFTDCSDVAFNEIYQTLDQLLYNQGITDYKIDPFIPIPNFSIINASFLIRLMSDHYEEGSVFLVIMSAVPNKPMRIFGKTKSGITFIGNNSGYFNWLFRDHGIEYVYKNNTTHTVEGRSFGGKYVQVPTASKILSGVSLNEIGECIHERDLSDFSLSEGTVVHCDNFGLMKIFAPALQGYKEQQKLSIKINDERELEAQFTTSLKDQPDGSLVLFEGSSLYGLPELGVVRSKNSAKELDIKVGDVITWKAL